MSKSQSRAHVSAPGNERVAMTPFGARRFIHALASETSGAFGVWDTFTPPGEGPAVHAMPSKLASRKSACRIQWVEEVVRNLTLR